MGPRDRLGRRAAGPGWAAARRVARRRAAHDVKSGPHRVVYRVELPEGTIYIKHFLVPELAGHAPPVGPPGQGTQRRQALAAPGRDRRADDHADRAGRTAEAEVPVRELPGHAWRSPTRFRSTSSSSSSSRSWPEPSPVADPPEARRGLAVMTARLHDAGLPPPGLPSRQHPGPARGRRRARAVHDRPRRPADEPARVTWKLARPEPGAARSFLLAAQQPDRPLSLPEDLPARTGRSRRPTSAASPGRSRTRPGSGPSGSGGAGAGVAGRRTSTSKSIRGEHAWCVASRDLDPAEIQPLLDDPDLPFREPGDDRAEGLADDDGRRDDDDGARAGRPR